MATQKLYAASFGPYLYDDSVALGDSDSDFPGMNRDASMTEGYHVMGGMRLLDTDYSNFLTVTWAEGDTSNRTLGILVKSGNRTFTLYENLTIGDGYDITITAEDAASAIVMDNANFEVESSDASQRSFKITSAKAGNTTLTMQEDLTIADGYDVTVQALGQANQLTLNEGFTIGDGNAGTLTFSGASKTLTVEDNSVVNQDLTSDAGPTFASCNLGTGELTAGSINRAADTLTLEIGGVAQASIATTELTITPTLTLSTCIDAGADVDKFLVLDGSGNVDYRTGSEVLSDIGASLGEAGSAAGQLVFWDTTKWVHTEVTELFWDDTNKRLGIGNASPNRKVSIVGSDTGSDILRLGNSHASGYSAISFIDNGSAYVGFFGYGNASVVITNFQGRVGFAGNGKDIIFSTDNGATAHFLINNSTGNVGIGLVAPAGKLHIDQSSATGAKPVLTLDQGDLSEEFIRLIGQSTTDATQSLVDAADMTTPGAIVGWFKMYVQDDQATNPITNGTYYVPFYSAPTP